MSRFEDEDVEQMPVLSRAARHITDASEMLHPDFHALLTYAQGSLDRESCKCIAGHVLVCESCSTELEQLEMEILPLMERPISREERLRWLAARLARRIRKAGSAAIGGGTHAPAGAIVWVNRLRRPALLMNGLAVALVALLLVLMVRSGQYRKLYEYVVSLTRQSEPIQQDSPGLPDQDEQPVTPDNQAPQPTTAGIPPEPPRDPRPKAGKTPKKQHTQEDRRLHAQDEYEPPPKYVRDERDMHESLNRSGIEKASAPKPFILRPRSRSVRPRDRIEIAFKSVPEARNYEITIFDLEKNEKEVCPKIDVGLQMQVTLSLASCRLRPGGHYSLQVEAILERQSKAHPSLSDVEFRVLDADELRAVEKAESDYKNGGFKLGTVFAIHGLVEEAQMQFELRTTQLVQARRRSSPIYALSH